MEFKVGDKVRIKKEYVYSSTCIDNIEELKKETLTVTEITNSHRIRLSRENGEDTGWSYNSNWLELVKKDGKFEEINMKYNIGDRVKIRRDLVVSEEYGNLTYLNAMKKEVEKRDIVTIKDTGIDSKGIVWYEFEELYYTYSEAMIEGLVESSTEKEELQTDSKFEAFLREVACVENDNYYKQNEMLDKLINPNDYFSVDEEELINELVEFYTNFKQKKKLTMAELREIVGEDFEIVEE